MVQTGHVTFSQMDEVVFGKPAAETIAEISRRSASAGAQPASS